MSKRDKNPKNLSRELFLETIVNRISDKMGKKYTITIRNVKKNNGVILQGIEIGKDEAVVKPCIYVDWLYKKYEEGVELDKIVRDIVKAYKEHKDEIKQDITFFTDYKKICGNIRGRLINTERNRELLLDVPHRELFDLSLVYYIDFPLEQGNGSVQITNWFLDMWNLTEEELYAQFTSNMNDRAGYVLESMESIMKRFLPDKSPFVMETACQMYVLTNESKVYGAVEILAEGALDQLSLIMGRNFMVIPASVHEMFIVPDEGTEEFADKIVQMIKEINDTQLTEQEILGYHVYRYDISQRMMEIAA